MFVLAGIRCGSSLLRTLDAIRRASNPRHYCCLNAPIEVEGRGCENAKVGYDEVIVQTDTDQGHLNASNTRIQADGLNGNTARRLLTGPSLKDFLLHNAGPARSMGEGNEGEIVENRLPPYLSREDFAGNGRRVFFETYGCQMNSSDTEIAWSILRTAGFERANSIQEADVILLMTCAIRDSAELKIWKRVDYLKGLKKLRRTQIHLPPLKIGILGCMAERLKRRIVEQEKQIDLVCGPDAYRDLPRMLVITESGQAAVNVLLSLDETYADLVPVRLNSGSPSAFVSIMRGCDNMCSYCIVPFTRGRERSRPIESILDEVRQLSDQNVKEITLLGQNVNSYRDTSAPSPNSCASPQPTLSAGFRTVYRARTGGVRFGELLDRVSRVNPDMRIRFTSPHPKDFPDEVLHLIRERPNVCRQLHLPAQSGSSRVLESMRRGYTRDAYLRLVERVKTIIPGVSLSSDFIAGFCGETEDDHQQTLDLMHSVKYQFAYCYPYSMRQKTHASHRLVDDVDLKVKVRRHEELIGVFREEAELMNRALIGQEQLVLIEGVSKRSSEDLVGRTDTNVKVVLSGASLSLAEEGCLGLAVGGREGQRRTMRPGDYVAVKITAATSQVLRGTVLHHTTISEYHHRHPLDPPMHPTTPWTDSSTFGCCSDDRIALDDATTKLTV